MTWPANVSMGRHGGTPGVPLELFVQADDLELVNVFADMGAWSDAHPCSCTDEAIDPDCRCCG